ncbi:MAG: hypothetical protein WCG45_05915 [bacterium]
MSIITLLIVIMVAVGFVVVVMAWSKSRGKIEIVLENPGQYKNGDVVKGKISISLKKNTHSNGLKLKLMASSSRSSGSGESEGVYEKEFEISGQKDYLRGEYPFEIQIPSDINNSDGMISPVGGHDDEEITWFLNAILKVPGSVDIDSGVMVLL